VPSKYILMSAGHHWPGVKDGKPTISRSTEDYAEAMIKWIKAIVTSDAFHNKDQGEKK
jgi:hypothetical protein